MTWRAKRDSLNELDQDIRDHLDRETAANVARGMTPDAAHAAAQRAFGNILLTKEATRAVWVPAWRINCCRTCVTRSGRSAALPDSARS
jgi:hypothetical protein